MPRKNLIRTNQYPYHVTIRTNNKDWFDLPMEDVWSICKDQITKAKTNFPVDIQAFVLMNNHYHLMLWTPNSNLDKFMYKFNLGISKNIREKTGRINRIFGDRYHWCLIKNQTYYKSVLKYIYQNPRRAGLTNKCEDYPFSTLHYITFKKLLGFDLFQAVPGDVAFYSWINDNQKFPKSFSKAIRKPLFKYPINITSRRKI